MSQSAFHGIRAGLIGSGFIGHVHLEALRRIGVQVTAICGSQSAVELGDRWAIPHIFRDYDFNALVESPEVDVIHIASPNRHHVPQAIAAIKAGKHVICEKPMAMDSREAAEMVELAARHPGQIFAVNYNVRFYPAVLQMRADVAAGRFGRILHVNGSYFQDWLLKEDDFNWRVTSAEGGPLRAVGDIGTHWMDMAGFIMGSGINRVFARLGTVHEARYRPTEAVKSFSSGDDAGRVAVPVDTEDHASILLDYENGAFGNLAVSQVAAGRKNRIQIEIYGTRESATWQSESPNVIHYGSRDQSNLESQRAAPGFQDAVAFTDYPAGHAEGFPDTFKMLYRAVYTDILHGRSANPLYAQAADGLREMQICEAILRSHHTQSWQPA